MKNQFFRTLSLFLTICPSDFKHYLPQICRAWLKCSLKVSLNLKLSQKTKNPKQPTNICIYTHTQTQNKTKQNSESSLQESKSLFEICVDLWFSFPRGIDFEYRCRLKTTSLFVTCGNLDMFVKHFVLWFLCLQY